MKTYGICWLMMLVVTAAAGAAEISLAEYELTFTAVWSAETHPTDFPSNPHFSGLVGGTHNDEVSFWEIGGLATVGIQRVAEMGRKNELIDEVNAAIDQHHAWSVVSELGISPSPGARTVTVPISSTYPLTTIVSMIAPSPDWFVGVSGLDLHQTGQWQEELVVDLLPYDAGTDSGTTFVSENSETFPREPISLIDGFPFENAPPLGTFGFRLLSVTDILLGDANGDREVNGLDVGPFVDTLVSGPYQLEADMNADGQANGLDVDPFVDVIISGGGVSAVPEPSTLLLLILGLLPLAGGPKGTVPFSRRK